MARERVLTRAERKTLVEMSIHHPDWRTRQRAQGLLWLGEGQAGQWVAEEFSVTPTSVSNWKRYWSEEGIVGLFEAPRSGRPRKLNAGQVAKRQEAVQQQGGSIPQLRRYLKAQAMDLPVHRNTLAEYLKRLGYGWKRTRYSLKKKRDESAFRKAQTELTQLQAQARRGELELSYLDESGFSPNPPIHASWTAVGETRAMTPGSHASRANVIGRLDYQGELHGLTYGNTIKQHHVIDALDLWADSLEKEAVVVLDNSSVHHGEAIEQKRPEWLKKGLRLFYLPPYSPELNLIEILWKQAKHFWRDFVYWQPSALVYEVDQLLAQYGTKFKINFC